MNIGKRIAKLREKKGWSQRELAKRANLNTSVMNRIETGERPLRAEELKIIANLLDVTADDILSDSKSSNLTIKEESDFKIDLENLIKKLEKTGYTSFDGQTLDEMDDEERELLINTLEQSMRIAKLIAKKNIFLKNIEKDK